ncbi:MAG: amino acid racemase [Candidatus Paceibacterota bacterium]
MIKKPTKKIGILGGAGPAATANFFNDIVTISQTKYGAEQDTEFPEVILYNMPMEGFNETGFADPESVKGQLISGVQKLESWGADFIALPCNTIHHFTKEMRDSIKIPIISIIESTVDSVKKNEIKSVGILSSRSTRELSLYKNALENEGINVFEADENEQQHLDNIVLKVMSGTQGEKEMKEMNAMVDRMSELGVQGVILGCTELPLAINQSDSGTKLFNTIKILAEYSVDEAYK